MKGRLRRWRRLDPDQRFGLRLTVAGVGLLAVGVPFLVLLVMVRDQWTPLHSLDLRVANDLHRVASRAPGLVRTLDVISAVFAPIVFRLVASGVAVWLGIRRRYRLASWVLVTTWVAAFFGVVTKTLVGRARPTFGAPVATAPGMSFPSGHALGSVVGCGVLLMVFLPLLPRAARRVAVPVAVLIVAAVGFARVGLGVHYVSDVLGGWALGLAWLMLTVAAFETWRQETGQRRTRPVEGEGLEPELAGRPGVPERRPG